MLGEVRCRRAGTGQGQDRDKAGTSRCSARPEISGFVVHLRALRRTLASGQGQAGTGRQADVNLDVTLLAVVGLLPMAGRWGGRHLTPLA